MKRAIQLKPCDTCWPQKFKTLPYLKISGSTTGVMRLMQRLQALPRDVSVDLRRGKIRVAQQHLNHAQIRTMVKQVSCEGMPERMR